MSSLVKSNLCPSSQVINANGVRNIVLNDPHIITTWIEMHTIAMCALLPWRLKFDMGLYTPVKEKNKRLTFYLDFSMLYRILMLIWLMERRDISLRYENDRFLLASPRNFIVCIKFHFMIALFGCCILLSNSSDRYVDSLKL